MYQITTRHKKLLADTITPVSIYLQLRDRFPGTLLLESSDYHNRENSFSYICCQPVARFKVEKGVITQKYPGETEEEVQAKAPGSVVDALQQFTSRFTPQDFDYKFATNGLFGYMAYEAVRYFEDIELEIKEEQGKAIPDILYNMFRFVLVVDHYKNELHLFEHTCTGHP